MQTTLRRLAPIAAALTIAAVLCGGTPARADTGGPDGFGYRWDDSLPYAPIAATKPTTLTLTDDGFAIVPIGFDFPFYGQTYDEVTVTSNGLLNFDGKTFVNWENGALPFTDNDGPYRLICPFWDDLNPEQGGEARYSLEGAAPDRVLVVDWVGIPHYNNVDDATLQLQLHESGEIQVHYDDTTFQDLTLDDGASATVGLQDGNTTGHALQRTFNSPVTPSGSALLFTTGCPDADGDGVDLCSGDCDDHDAAVQPGAAEADNGVDDDCDGQIDEGLHGILVVDEDDGGNWERLYLEVLADKGWSVSVWDVAAAGAQPDLAALSAYDVVVWAGDPSGGPDDQAETDLDQWMVDQSGRMFISAQEYVFVQQGPSPFMETYLGVGKAFNDAAEDGYTSELIAAGPHPISDPYKGAPVGFLPPTRDVSDLVVASKDATLLFESNGKKGGGAVLAWTSKTNRSTYWLHSWMGVAAADPEEAADLLDRSLRWLCDLDDDGDLIPACGGTDLDEPGAGDDDTGDDDTGDDDTGDDDSEDDDTGDDDAQDDDTGDPWVPQELHMTGCGCPADLAGGGRGAGAGGVALALVLLGAALGARRAGR